MQIRIAFVPEFDKTEKKWQKKKPAKAVKCEFSSGYSILLL